MRLGRLGGGQVRRRRRRWSEAQKRQIVSVTHEPGVSVPMCCSARGLRADRRDKLLKLLDAGGQNWRITSNSAEMEAAGRTLLVLDPSTWAAWHQPQGAPTGNVTICVSGRMGCLLPEICFRG